MQRPLFALPFLILVLTACEPIGIVVEPPSEVEEPTSQIPVVEALPPTPPPAAASCTGSTYAVQTYAGAGSYQQLEYAFNFEAIGQSFTLAAPARLHSLQIFGGGNESGGTLDAEIWTGESGVPTAQLGSTSIADLNVGGSAWRTGAFDSVNVLLSANTVYWAVFRYQTSYALWPMQGKFTAWGDPANRYAGGLFLHYQNSDGLWNGSPYSANVDAMMIVKTCVP